jgi:hypothetical protein
MTLRKVWVQRCYRKDSFNVDNARICSKHFTPEDFKRDLYNEMMGLQPRRLLKDDAVPKVKQAQDAPSSERTLSVTRSRKRERQDLTSYLLEPPPCSKRIR